MTSDEALRAMRRFHDAMPRFEEAARSLARAIGGDGPAGAAFAMFKFAHLLRRAEQARP